MAADDIPEAILRRHPELIAVGEALDAHREGRQTTARCPTCDGPLRVDEPSDGVLVVVCVNGHVLFRARRDTE